VAVARRGYAKHSCR